MIAGSLQVLAGFGGIRPPLTHQVVSFMDVVDIMNIVAAMCCLGSGALGI